MLSTTDSQVDQAVPDRLTRQQIQRLGFESFWIIIGQALAAVGGIVGVRLLTGVLNPGIYGELALAMTVVALVQTTLLAPLGRTFMRYFAPSREKEELQSFLQGAKRYLVEATAAILIGVAIVALFLVFSGQVALLGLLFTGTAYTLFSGYSLAIEGMQNAARQRVIVAWHRGLRVWLQFLFAFAIVNRTAATSTAAMTGYALSATIVFVSQYAFFRLKIQSLSQKQPPGSREVYKNILGQMRAYAWPLMTWGIFVWLRASSDRWAIQTFGTTYEVGLFEVLFQLGFYPVSLGLGLVIQLVNPVLFEMAGNATDPLRMQRVRKLNHMVLILTLLVTGAGVLLSYFLSDWVFSLFAAPEYQQVSWLMPWMVLSAGLFIAAQVAGQLAAVCFQTKALLAPQIGVGILGVSASFAAAYLWGLPGVVAAGIVVGLIQLLWVLRVKNDVFSTHLQKIESQKHTW